MHRYPDGGSNDLRIALARHFSLDADRILIGNGSDELISLLVRAFAGPGDEVLYSAHGFLMYAISAKASAPRRSTRPRPIFTANVDALLAAVTERTKLVFLANPNNPTGTWLPASEMQRLHAGLPPPCRARHRRRLCEFVESGDYDPGIELVLASENTVMLRTFSKLYALGGMRVGWAFCPPGIADALNRLRALQCQRGRPGCRRRGAR